MPARALIPLPLLLLLVSLVQLGSANDVTLNQDLKLSFTTHKSNKPGFPGGDSHPEGTEANPWVRLTVVTDTKDNYWGIGFGGEATMKDTDIIVGWVDGSDCRLYDTWSLSSLIPPEDSTIPGCENNLHVEKCSTDGDSSSLTFWRRADTGDSRCDFAWTDSKTVVVAAMGTIPDRAIYNIDYHSERTERVDAAVANFFTGEVEEAEDTSGEKLMMKLIVLYAALIIVILGATIAHMSQKKDARPSSAYLFLHKPTGLFEGNFWERNTDITWGELLVFIVLTAVSITTYYMSGKNVSGCGALSALFFVLLSPVRAGIYFPLTGSPFDRLVKLHRMAGRLAWVLATVHFISSLSEFGIDSITAETANVRGLVGFISWIALTLQAITSSSNLIRNKMMNFGIWMMVHAFFSFVTAVCALLHLRKSWLMWVLTIGLAEILLMVNMFFRMKASFRRLHPTHMEYEEAPEGGQGWCSVQFQMPGNFNFGAGQYCFLTLKGIPGWHPFSIVSSPSDPDRESGKIGFVIKKMGDKSFTAKLANKIANGNVDDVNFALEGPYGGARLPAFGFDYSLFICGGIGFTPMWSYAREMFTNNTLNVRSTSRGKLVWVLRANMFRMGIARKVYDEMRALAGRDSRFTVELYITGGKIDDCEEGSEGGPISGRPDFVEIMRLGGAEVAEVSGSRMGVFACGPDPLIASAQKAASFHNKSEQVKASVHHEIFSF